MKGNDPCLSLQEARLVSLDQFEAENLLANPAFPLWFLEDPEEAQNLWLRCEVRRKESQLMMSHWMFVEDTEVYEIDLDDHPSVAGGLSSPRYPTTLDLDHIRENTEYDCRVLPLNNGELEGELWSFGIEEPDAAAHEADFVRLWARAMEEV